jgi:hypothetical protein
MQNDEQTSNTTSINNSEFTMLYKECFEKLQISSIMEESFESKSLQLENCLSNHKILLEIAINNSLDFQN